MDSIRIILPGMSARTSAPTRRNNEISRQSDRRHPPVLRRGFAQTLRVGSKNFTEQFMLCIALSIAYGQSHRNGT